MGYDDWDEDEIPHDCGLLRNGQYKIDGYPVSRQEVLDQATMICGNPVKSFGLALRILRNDGRDVTEN